MTSLISILCQVRLPRFALAVSAMTVAWVFALPAPAFAAGSTGSVQPDRAPASAPASAPVSAPVSASAPAPAAVSEPAAPPAERLAGELLATIPPGSRLSLRPLVPQETGLPQEAGRRLYESILNAVFHAARSREVVVLPRESLRKIYESLYEFGQGNVESMLREARAEIEVICEAFSVADGVDLSCGAWDLEGTFSHARAMARFPLERQVARLDHALAEMARRLAEDAPAVGEVERVMIMDASIGARGDLGSFVGNTLEGKLIEWMGERAKSEEEKVRVATALGTEPPPPAERLTYRMEGTLWRLDDELVRLEVRLKHCGRTRVAASADISASSLPAQPGKASVGGEGGQVHEAVAEAAVSERLDRASALRAARNLARARVVAQAIGLPPPGVTVARTEANAVMAFAGFLDRGLPVDERFSDAWTEGDSGAEERLAVRLTARVVPVGGLIRPAVSARLDRNVYRAMEPMRIEIRSEETAHLGVFAWGADNRVVRLYPKGRGQLGIGAGETLVLPRPRDGDILSAPMPIAGNREDHEAFVVVATARSIDFAALAPEAGASLSGTMQRAVDGSGFLTALAGNDPARMAVIWLPYQVHD